jgi:hypothetical protein
MHDRLHHRAAGIHDLGEVGAPAIGIGAAAVVCAALAAAAIQWEEGALRFLGEDEDFREALARPSGGPSRYRVVFEPKDPVDEAEG